MSDGATAAAPGARFAAAVRSGRTLLLDGPTGTELLARGFSGHRLLWTAEAAERAPALLRQIHRDYLDAGAEILTANTFRTTGSAAARAGVPVETAHRWLQCSVELARAVAADHAAAHPDEPPRLVAGSLAPLGDCYRPDETPDDETLRSAHAQTAAWLGAARCDLILVETQVTRREARIAVESAAEAGLPVLVSFLPDGSSRHLLGGDPLAEAAADCLRAGAAGVLVNCAHAAVLDRALDVLLPLRATGALVGAYANSAHMRSSPTGPAWLPDERPLAVQIADYARIARRWHECGARIVGGCCGMSPAFIAAVRAALDGQETIDKARL